MSRQLCLRLGRDGPVQRFSLSSEPDDAVAADVLTTLRASTHPSVRYQTLLDPTKCTQFACVWGNSVGFLTRPVMVEIPPNPPTVLGSFSDRIGHALPVCVSLDDFQGSFTTLTTTARAEEFLLPRHPTPAASIRGPPPAPLQAVDGIEPVTQDDAPPPQEGTLGRLHWPVSNVENPPPSEHPVVVALPCFLPLAPGQTFPLDVDLTKPDSYAEAFPLFRLWCDGIRYTTRHNDSHSVTMGGPLFHLPDFDTQEDPDPFHQLRIRPTLPAHPHQIPPTFATFHQIEQRIQHFSEEVWIRLGARDPRASASPPTPSTPGDPAMTTRDLVQAVVTPLLASRSQLEVSTKEAEHLDSAQDVALSYRLAFATLPSEDASQQRMIFPPLHPLFMSILTKTKPVVAAQALQNLVRSRVDAAHASDKAVECDVTFDPEACTTAFANAIRSYHWLLRPLTDVSRDGARHRLGILHFLTPKRGFFLVNGIDEATNNPIVLSHVSDEKAQLEASKTSALFADGRLETGFDMYLAVCNFSMVISVMLASDTTASTPLLLQKLLRYAAVLRSPAGRSWCDTWKYDLRIPVHIYQDVQHMLTTFLMLGTKPILKSALKKGDTISPDNYWNAARLADGLIDKLQTLVTGNNLGNYSMSPICLQWFPALNLPHAATPNKSSRQHSKDVDVQSFRTPTPKGTPSQAAAPKKQRLTDKVDIDRRKQLGILLYDTVASGSTRLPHCPVYSKAQKDSTSPERLCMQFMTQGFYCSRHPCPFPHISNVARLSAEQRDAFAKWVSDTKGLSFAQGKGPAGTP